MKKFAITGVAGFIAPRHLKAIKEIGGNLVVAQDPFDSVGILDSYFPHCAFTTSFEELEQRLAANDIDYLSICTPNYLHKDHSIRGLQYGCNVICEKPLVLNVDDIYKLKENEEEYGGKIYTILQLRHHPAIIALREKVSATQDNKRFKVDLKYITSRGQWYFASWKGDVTRSGGLATNIGIHFFDMLIWVFGSVVENKVLSSSVDTVSGMLSLEKADVKYILSVNEALLPEEIVAKGKRTFRTLVMDGEKVDFSDGFSELHTEIYRQILAGKGFGLEDAIPSIKLLENIRQQQQQFASV